VRWRPRRGHLAWLALPLLLAGAGGVARADHAGMRRPFQERFQGHPAPPFTLPDLQGREVSLRAYRGRVVLLNFWYSSCPPCRKETPDLVTLDREHRKEGLAVLGINLDSVLIPQFKGQMLQSFLRAYPIDYPVLIADGKVFEDYGRIPVQPISFLVDRDGTVARVFWGAFPRAVYEQAIRPYLDRPLRRAGGATPVAGAGPATPATPGRPLRPAP
jgi:cytochrome c biogenesis protein CcmG, thiol:disulfide interchange protein DsbE